MLRSRAAKSTAYRWGSTALFLALVAILTALGFEHLAGMQPCPLCLQQRWAYYGAIPTTFVALVLLSAGYPRSAAVLFGLIALAYLGNAGLGTYHAGVEWGFWPGPDTCAASGSGLNPARSLLEQLQNTRVIRCDQAAARFGGLSFAGWNVVACVMLSTAALKAAFAARDHEVYL